MSAHDIKLALKDKHSNSDWGIFFEVTIGVGGGRMDGLAIKKSWKNPQFVGYEIKTSRSDFKNDEKWPQYMDFCHKFYFVCPKGLIDQEEIEEMDDRVGLIYYSEDYVNKVHTLKKATFRNLGMPPKDMLYRIIMSVLDRDRYPFHSKKKEFFKDWLENKKDNRHLARKIDGAIGDLIKEQEDKIKNIRFEERRIKNIREDLEDVINYLQQRGVISFTGFDEESKERLMEIVNGGGGLSDKEERHLRTIIKNAKKLEHIIEED